ncbi:MAG: hypothetical protein U0892_18005 [Pirellulales bacterium]
MQHLKPRAESDTLCGLLSSDPNRSCLTHRKIFMNATVWSSIQAEQRKPSGSSGAFS